MRLFILAPRHLLESISAALDRDGRFDMIARTEGEADMIETLAQSGADVLVLGTDVLDGELVRQIERAMALSPAARILVLGRAESDEQVVDCLLAGAAGFLLHDASPEEVAVALEMVARGERVCPPRVMRLLFDRLGRLGRERKRRDRLEVLELTAREMEILRLIADGLTNRQIAGRLYLSAYTVKNHVHRILDALGVQSRRAAVNHAYAKGWLRSRVDPGSTG